MIWEDVRIHIEKYKYTCMIIILSVMLVLLDWLSNYNNNNNN